MQGIKAALHTVAHLQQTVQSGWGGSYLILGTVLGGLGKVKSLLHLVECLLHQAPPPDRVLLCYSTICQHDPARPITDPLSPQ